MECYSENKQNKNTKKYQGHSKEAAREKYFTRKRAAALFSLRNNI